MIKSNFDFMVSCLEHGDYVDTALFEPSGTSRYRPAETYYGTRVKEKPGASSPFTAMR